MEHIVNKEDSKETEVFSTSKSNIVSKDESASREEAKDEELKQCPSTEPKHNVQVDFKTMPKYRKIQSVSSSGEKLVKTKEFPFSKTMKLNNPSASGEKVPEVKPSELNADASGRGKIRAKGKKELAIPGPSKLVADSSGSGQMPKVAKQLAHPAPDMEMGNSRGKKGSFENMDPKFCVEKPPWAQINSLDEKSRDYTALSKKGIGKDCVALKHCPPPKQRKRLQRALMKFQEWLKSR